MSAENKILVTGAAGFFGGRAASFFATERKEQWKVRATSRRSSKEKELKEKSAEYLAGDLCEAEFCQKITQGVKVVLHAAALSSPWGDYQTNYDANVKATENLLNAAQKNGTEKFIFISTPSVYFDFSEKLNIKENDTLPAKPVNNYAATKLLAEQKVLSAHCNKMKTLALRPRAIIGAEDTVIFPRLIKAYLEGKLKIIGNGLNRCDLTNARNLIHAVEKCFTAPDDAWGEVYNITNGDPVVLWEEINFVLTELGHDAVKKKVPESLAMSYAGMTEFFHRFLRRSGEPSVTRYGLAALSTGMTLNIDKAKQKLNYSPLQSNREGILEFIEWHKQQS